MAPKATEFEREMQHLEAEIKKLEAEYNMFFAGRLPRLPWETRARVETLVKKYDRAPLRNTAERFRFSTLQSRFMSFCDLWEKALKAREEGRALPGRGRKPPAAVAPPPNAATVPRQHEQLVHEARIRNPQEQADRLQELYQQLAEAREQTGEAQIPFNRFAEVVKAQVQKLGTGTQDVTFRVAVADGKVKLTVKAVE